MKTKEIKKKKKKYNRDLLDYKNSIMLEWQKKLINEQSTQNNVEMDVALLGGVGNVGNTPYPIKPQVFNPIKKNGGNIKPQRDGRHNSYQSPHRPNVNRVGSIQQGPQQSLGYIKSHYAQNNGPQYQHPPFWQRGPPPYRGRGSFNHNRGRDYKSGGSDWWRNTTSHESNHCPPFREYHDSNWGSNVLIYNSFFPLSDRDTFEDDHVYNNIPYTQVREGPSSSSYVPPSLDTPNPERLWGVQPVGVFQGQIRV